MIFLENCNFSSKEAKWEGISLENLVFFTGFHNSHENCNFSSKDTKRECTSMENFIFCTSGNDTPFTFGYRPEFSFELK